MNKSLFILYIVFTCISLYAIQPFDIIKKNPSDYYVRQGPGQCAPASFYMVFRYYGDDRKDYMFSRGPCGNLFSMNIRNFICDVTSDQKNISQVIITRNSSVAEWMNDSSGSTGWFDLTEALMTLYFVNGSGQREVYYNTISSCDESTDPGVRDQDIRMTSFYRVIIPEFLSRGRPVVVHLKRKWSFPGHYIVLIGFDQTTSTVLYMDPNNKDDQIIKNVRTDEFINSYWYNGDPDIHWGNAGWSGRWIVFYRNKTGIPHQ